MMLDDVVTLVMNEMSAVAYSLLNKPTRIVHMNSAHTRNSLSLSFASSSFFVSMIF